MGGSIRRNLVALPHQTVGPLIGTFRDPADFVVEGFGQPLYIKQPPPQPFGGPPPFQQGPQPPQGGFQQQGGFPPQGGYQQQGFGQSPLQQSFNQQGYGPPQGYGVPPSPGYDPRAAAMGDASNDADTLRGAMKGFGTNEDKLIQVLAKPDPLQIALLRKTYSQRHNRSLEEDIKKETSSYFKEALLAIVRGPLVQDVELVYGATKGLGTKESMLNDVLLGRSNADMRAIKQEYQHRFGHTLEADVQGDLSMKTGRLFSMAMAANRAEENAPIIPQEIDRDVSDLHRATEGKVGTDQITVCSILALRSDGQLRTIAQRFEQKYRINLEKVLKKEFSGHMEEALLLMLGRATDRAMTDAVQVEDTMKGMGTKDNLLVQRTVRVHWDRQHMDQVKRAYAFRFKKDLIARVRSETSRDYQKLMVAIWS